jgi:hypothetical protein
MTNSKEDNTVIQREGGLAVTGNGLGEEPDEGIVNSV